MGAARLTYWSCLDIQRREVREGGAWEADLTCCNLKHCLGDTPGGVVVFWLPNCEVSYSKCIPITIFRLIFHLEILHHEEEKSIGKTKQNKTKNRTVANCKEISSCSQTMSLFLSKYRVCGMEHKEIIFTIWGKLFIPSHSLVFENCPQGTHEWLNY